MRSNSSTPVGSNSRSSACLAIGRWRKSRTSGPGAAGVRGRRCGIWWTPAPSQAGRCGHLLWLSSQVLSSRMRSRPVTWCGSDVLGFEIPKEPDPNDRGRGGAGCRNHESSPFRSRRSGTSSSTTRPPARREASRVSSRFAMSLSERFVVTIVGRKPEYRTSINV